jgi:5-oxoprolinase (ATP-hydrolysing)
LTLRIHVWPNTINGCIELLYPGMNQQKSKWKFTVDRGGTFTDIIGVDPEGQFHILKLLSRSSAYKDASIEGIRRILKLDAGDRLPGNLIEGIRFGTTVATNALLERKGCNVALLITRGFADLLEIGYQNRPDIFRLCIKKSSPLYSTIVEIDERLDHKGGVIKEPDLSSLSMEIKKLKKSGTEAVAVVLMHSWINPDHEVACEKELRRHGFSDIFLSHKSVNLIKIVSRGQSTLLDAYLSTVLAGYLEGIKAETGRIPLEFMQSSGVLTPPEYFTGKNAILSGPAGGLVAVAKTTLDEEIEGAIGFDMGGTSTDVSRFEGEFEKINERVIADIPLQTEMLDIITVASGGGSILNFDGRKMTAGPESAGSFPGPSCYGFGGPLTVTDANLVTGRIAPEHFPETFGADGKSSLDCKFAEEKFLIMTEEVNRAMGTAFTARDIANGFLRVANEKMAMAIREISVSRGFDVRNYALVCFGGAGGQHACSVASLLDIDIVIIHPLSSVMSAYGIGLSKPAWKSSMTLLNMYKKTEHDCLADRFNKMEEEIAAAVQWQGGEFIVKREIDLRPAGADSYLTVEYGSYDDTVRNFKEQYERLYGFSPGDSPLEVVNLKVEILDSSEFLVPFEEKIRNDAGTPDPDSSRELYYADGPVKSPVYHREKLPPLVQIKGPAFVVDKNFTVIVDPGYEAETCASGTIVIKRIEKQKTRVRETTAGPDPVLLEVFNNLFMGIAAEMGITLRNTAFSVNMKERLDFSCAVFDAGGGLVANAPHIPVHLGSMADTVKEIIKTHARTMKQGDAYLTNNPYKGGSHLSDMTVICPVFSAAGDIMFFTAARGHHSDVGGTTPGSMPPNASHIDEEGVLVDGFLLVRDGALREDELKELLLNHKYPARNIPERVFDFRAQIAACHKGVEELQHLVSRYGLDTVRNYMTYIQDNSEYSVKGALHQFLGEGNSFKSVFEDYMDDSTPIRVSITVAGGHNPPDTLKALVDFTGTGGQHLSDNLNAPASVTRSAVMYVLRSLIDNDIPLNSGCLKPVDIIIPESSILNPMYPAPVASGNVETSQRVVDALLGALGIAAASQGTMNNFLFEVEGGVPYYETIAGGSGAMQGCPGVSGVQVHMTNTRMTDPEVLEYRHPGVRIEQFTLRKGSGGNGEFRGGDGVVREIKFLKPSTASIISERRKLAPYGINGGENGKKGINLLKKADGEVSDLGHREVLRINENESVIIKTPGGGGYGTKIK